MNAPLTSQQSVRLANDPAGDDRLASPWAADFPILARPVRKRRLAYPINYKTDGYYVLMYVTAPPELPRTTVPMRGKRNSVNGSSQLVSKSTPCARRSAATSAIS